MLEVIFGIRIIEFIATLVILIDFGPEAVKKVKAWGSKDHWLR